MIYVWVACTKTNSLQIGFMMILFVKLTKGIGHKFYQLMKSFPMQIGLYTSMG
jgi:hypothetical protein